MWFNNRFIKSGPIQYLLNVLMLAASTRSREVPSEVCHLPRLASLDMSHNSLSALPDEMPRLEPSLRDLDLSHNVFAELPPSLLLLSGLRRLDIRGNVELPTTARLAAVSSRLEIVF